MAMKPCKNCRWEVSSSAKTCPHCGVKYPTGGLRFPVKIGLIILALFVTANLLSRENADSKTTATKGTPHLPAISNNQIPKITMDKIIPNSRASDRGEYHLLGMKRLGTLITTIHKRVGSDYVGYTVCEINCERHQIRDLGYGEGSIDDIKSSTSEWYELVPGSSKSDLFSFVCSMMN